jgi:ketosteroid isomerase-like protein
MNHEEFFARRTQVVNSGRWTELISDYAEDAVVHQPFALPEPVTLRGRAEIARHLARGEALPLQMTVRNAVVHETADPEVFIAEYDYDLRVPTTGKTATVANIQLFRVRDGLIVESRDYHDHAGIGRVLGR